MIEPAGEPALAPIARDVGIGVRIIGKGVVWNGNYPERETRAICGERCAIDDAA